MFMDLELVNQMIVERKRREQEREKERERERERKRKRARELINLGLLDFSKPIREYVHGFKACQSDDCRDADIIDVLTHRVGVPRYYIFIVVVIIIII